jgi:hypothetical protein
LVVHEPHGDFGDADGPFGVFDAVELIDVDFEEGAARNARWQQGNGGR